MHRPAYLDYVGVKRFDADGAVIAADHANRILAVSRGAAELLGYDAAEDLVGERIVSIVPER